MPVKVRSDHNETIRRDAVAYAEQGAAIVPLHPKSKKPISNGWTGQPRMSATEVEDFMVAARNTHGAINIGIRLGEPSRTADGHYIHVIDVDVRNPRDSQRCRTEALEAVYSILPELKNAPRVLSGSGSGSQHIYFTMERPVAKIRLARSERMIERVDKGGALRPEWEVDILGTGAQAVMPPSIHPNGTRYVWDEKYRPFFDDGFFSPKVIQIPVTRLDSLRRRRDASEARNKDASNPFERDGVIDYAAVHNAVMTIRNDHRFGNRADWIKVCGALHHATEGTSEGLEIFQEWCETWTGGKSDADENEAAWCSMRAGRKNGATTAALVWLAKRDGWSPPDWMEPPIEFKDERKRERLEASLTISSKTWNIADEGDDVPPNRVSVADLAFTGAGGDLYNGRAFAQLYRERLLFIHETGDVLRFDQEGGWLAAAPGTAERAAKAVVRMLRDLANDAVQMRHIERLCDVRAQRAMIEMARSEHGMTRRLSEFDSEPTMLGVANGVVDLETGRLLPVSPSLLVSKRCNVVFDPRAECPRFDQFMREVQPDRDVRTFLRRFAGYCLTGRVDQHVFGFFYGHGANGKSTFIELLAWILGDYAGRIATELLMQHQRSPQGPSPDVLLLRGKRLVFANETEEGARLASSRIKELTGGDTLSARAPYGRDFVSFAPSHKLVIVGNHQPEIADTSFGMWRRVRLVPWELTIAPERRDPQLLEKLKTESSGILNWALDGLRAMQEDGLRIPKAIADATRVYRDDQDIIGEWIEERCSVGPTRAGRKGDLYDDYWRWAERNGHKPLAQKRLTRRLTESRFRLSRDRRAIEGLALKTSDDDS